MWLRISAGIRLNKGEVDWGLIGFNMAEVMIVGVQRDGVLWLVEYEMASGYRVRFFGLIGLHSLQMKDSL